MLKKLFARLTGANEKSDEETQAAAFQELNKTAPLTAENTLMGELPGPAAAKTSQAMPPTAAFLCRETILGRDQRVAGYQFMLHEGTRNRIRLSNRRIHHIYSEVMVRSLARSEISRLLGARLAFVDLPDSFLWHPSLDDLHSRNTVLMLSVLPGEGAPDTDPLVERVRLLKQCGFKIALHETALALDHAALLPFADCVSIQTDEMGPGRLKELVQLIQTRNPQSALLVRGLPSQEEFQLCYDLGARHFQGPFIMRRQNWTGNKLGPNATRLADLLNRLHQDAEIHELADLLKTDPALSLRMLHYLNSPAVGLPNKIQSIEQALVMLGRERLQRWVLLLLYNSQSNSPRSSALLENALVRARMMELLGRNHNAMQRESLYLVGMLSLIDLILELPMEKALETLATTPEICAALLRGEGWMSDYLELAIASESLDVEKMESLAERCGVDAHDASLMHIEALAWGMEVNH
jgi:c-di-GMP phosphodiesterase